MLQQARSVIIAAKNRGKILGKFTKYSLTLLDNCDKMVVHTAIVCNPLHFTLYEDCTTQMAACQEG